MKENKNATKWQLERFAFYDKAAIEKKLTAMAAQGWLIEQPGNLFWRYRRIEPKRLYFAVTYFPNASEFDPAPTEGEQQMEEFCAHDGWNLTARWGQLQIFCNEQENPAPIETDPTTQVETIHRAMKRNMLPLHFLLIALSFFELAMTGWQFLRNPVEFLATRSSLFMAPAWLLIALPLMLEVFWYFRWYNKAKLAAARGDFYELKTNHAASYLLLGISLLLILLAFRTTALLRVFIPVWLLFLVVPAIVVRIVSRWMKNRGYARRSNLIVTLSVSMILTMVLLGGLIAAILHNNLLLSNDQQSVGTYDLNGWKMEVYADPLPLYVQDLTDTTCEAWSTRARTKETFLVSSIDYDQQPLTKDTTVPGLDYTVTQIKVPFLYEFCKNSLINSRQDVIRDGELLLTDHYEAIDAAPWSAQEAYRVYWSDSYLNKYLLCYEDILVEIQFAWEPTQQQMQIVAEKLGRK